DGHQQTDYQKKAATTDDREQAGHDNIANGIHPQTTNSIELIRDCHGPQLSRSVSTHLPRKDKRDEHGSDVANGYRSRQPSQKTLSAKISQLQIDLNGHDGADEH